MTLKRVKTGSSRDYKRGAVMGLTVAEAFILLSFILLLLFAWWQVDADRRSRRLADTLGNISHEQKEQILKGLSDGTFALALKLREIGITEAGSSAIEDIAQFRRFMRKDDLKRLLNGAMKLAPNTRLKLSETIEITPEQQLLGALNAVLNPDSRIVLANKRLSDYAQSEQDLVDVLNRKLGSRIRLAGGRIDAAGTITLPQDVLFEQGSSTIQKPGFLLELCSQWVRTLRESGLDISELKIEGHASSEGRSGQTPEQAYMENLDLSQRRAQNALRICLDGLADTSILGWARGRLSSTGYSSSRLIYDESGNEDREASRRVMFSLELNRKKLLQDLQSDLGTANSKSVTSHRDVGRSRPRIIDGDTLAIGEQRWRLFGIDAPENGQMCTDQKGYQFDCGKQATDELIRLVGRSPIRCEEIEKDHYGRSVGKCYVGNTDLSRMMVKRGMARAYIQYSREYASDEIQARSEKIGFWAGEFNDPATYRRSR